MTVVEVLLTVEETAERLNTSPRFVRRLIEERRIAYIKLGTTPAAVSLPGNGAGWAPLPSRRLFTVAPPPGPIPLLSVPDAIPPILATQRNWSIPVPLICSLVGWNYCVQARTIGSGQNKASNCVEGIVGN